MGCRQTFDWVINLVLWGGLAYIIIASLMELSKGAKDAAKAWIIISGIIYLLNAFISSHCSYFMHQTDAGKIYEKMDQTFKKAPSISMHIECYHFETRTVEHTDHKGVKTKHQEQVRVVTHTDAQEFSYKSWRDISGQFKLDITESMRDEDICYVTLSLAYEINFANDGSSDDFDRARKKFKEKNQKDKFQSYSESFTISGFEDKFLVQLTEDTPAMFGLGYFVFFTFLTFHAFYREFIDRHCHEQSFTIKKVVSTKQDLHAEELKKQYEYYDPRMVFKQQAVVFNPTQPPQFIPMMPMGQPVMGYQQPQIVYIPPPPPPPGTVLFYPVNQFAEVPPSANQSMNQTMLPLTAGEQIQQVNVIPSSNPPLQMIQPPQPQMMYQPQPPQVIYQPQPMYQPQPAMVQPGTVTYVSPPPPGATVLPQGAAPMSGYMLPSQH